MTRFDIESWPEDLSALEERFIPRHLSISLRYLRESRVPGKGWPRYPGLPTDLHSSALAVYAMSLVGDQSLQVVVANGTSFIREEYGKERQESLEDILDLLLAASAESNPDTSYVRSLQNKLGAATGQAEKGEQELTTHFISQALMVSQGGRNPLEYARPWAELLIRRQRSETGGWATSDSDDESLPATAWAVRALADLATPESQKATTSGLYYIHSKLKEGSWEAFVASGGTYGVSLVLRALFAAKSKESDLVESGTSVLRALMNADGGWGGGAGEISSIEYTAYAVLALLEGGDNRFIPLRVGLEALEKFRSYSQELETERDRLKDDFMGRVEVECGNVVIERDRFKKELQSTQGEIRSLQKELQRQRDRISSLQNSTTNLETELMRAARQADRGRTESFTKINPVIVAGAALSVCLLAAFAYGLGANWNWLVKGLLLGGVLALGGLTAYMWVRLTALSRRARALEIERKHTEDYLSAGSLSSGTIYDLVDDFRYVTDSFPASVREELIYRLLREGVDLPRDIGYRFVRDLMLDMGVPPRQSQRLEVWLERLMSLEPETRRMIMLQLRRAIL